MVRRNSAETQAAVLGCAHLAAGEGSTLAEGEGSGLPGGHLQCGEGRLGNADGFLLHCGAALQNPHPGLGAPVILEELHLIQKALHDPLPGNHLLK